MSHILADENAIAPGTPSSGKSIIYPKSDGLWYSKDDAGTETSMVIVTPVTVPNGGTGVATLTGIVKGNGASAMSAVTAPSVTIVGTSDTQTLSNKRRTPRVNTIASSATPTTNTDNYDVVNITALAAAITSMTTNLSGTPTIGDPRLFQILYNGTARAITWGASFAAKGVALPTTTVISKLLTVGFIWNGSTWGCVASAQEV